MKVGVTLANCSSRARTHWSEQVAIPKRFTGDTPPTYVRFVSPQGQAFLGVRGEDLGTRNASYRFKCQMVGDELVDGFVIDDVKVELPWLPHKWILDDVQAMVPMCSLYRDGSLQQLLTPLNFDLASWSPAHQRFRYRMASVDLGLVQEVYAEVLNGDPVMRLYGGITWSDRRDPARLKTFPGALGLMSGEQLALDFATRHGWRYSEGLGKRTVIFGADVTFADGCSIPFSGSVLCFRGPSNVPPDWTPDSQDNLDVENLHAAKQGPIVGICHEHDQLFLAHKNVPVARPATERGVEWLQFKALMQQPANLFVARPEGCAPWPGQTGDQQDFGAQKGTLAVSHRDPRWLYMARYSAQAECFRGYRHFEADGSSLDPSKHPDWMTWGGKTAYFFYERGTRTLNKEGGYHPTAPGEWTGYDDEHRSQNLALAYAALSGDPFMIEQLLHLTTTDVCSYVHLQRATGPLRAEGRLSHVWANMGLVLPGEAQRRAIEMLGLRITLAKDHPGLHIAGPMKVMAFHDVDLRKPIYNDQGQLVRTVTMWELALQLVGVYAIVKGGQAQDPVGAEFVLRELSRTMARYGCFVQADKHYIVGDVEWRDGNHVPIEASSVELVNGQQRYKLSTFAPNAGDVMMWTAVGLMIAYEALGFLGNTTEDQQLIQKIGDVCGALGIDSQNPPTRRHAEWWAATLP